MKHPLTTVVDEYFINTTFESNILFLKMFFHTTLPHPFKYKLNIWLLTILILTFSVIFKPSLPAYVNKLLTKISYHC